MPYYRFFQDDIFYNQIETRPKSVFYIYSGSIFYNNMPTRRGTIGNIWAENLQNADIPGVPNGNISLYEMNVDRDVTAHTWQYGLSKEINEQQGFKKTVIHPFMTKAGGLQTFKTMTTGTLNTLNYGDTLTASFSYPLSASIQREYYSLNQDRFVDHQPQFNQQFRRTERKYSHIDALKNTFDHYKILSQHYAYSASNPPGCDKSTQELCLISIPSIFYGSSIKKGTVDLKFYISGTLAARCVDKYKNGELIEVTGSQTGSVAGVVLYNEGFLCLTGSWDLTNRTATNTTDPKVPTVPGTNTPAYPLSPHTEKYSPGFAAVAPKWTYFATGIERSGSGPDIVDSNAGTAGEDDKYQTGYGIFATGSLSNFHLPSSSFSLEFQGINYVPVITMLAHAPVAELNHSNNPTFVSSNSYQKPHKKARLGINFTGTPSDADTITLIDAAGTSKTFEFDTNSSITDGNIQVELTASTAVHAAAQLAATINAQSDYNITANLHSPHQPPDEERVSLTQTTTGSDGNTLVVTSGGGWSNCVITGSSNISASSHVAIRTAQSTGTSAGADALYFRGGGLIVSKHSGSNIPVFSGSKTYIQDKYIPIKNTVSSSYANHTASFSKQTYISKIGIYDENRNLIGIAKLATPVKKTEERDLTFKLKLDL